MGFATVRTIVTDTVIVIWDRLQAAEMPIPDHDKWTSIADKFFARCDFPLCIGALDGKHVKIKAPPNSGSKYFNYKGHHSVVLMAIADADCKFIVINVGAYGSNSDGGILQDSAFYKLLNSNNLNIPNPTFIPGTNTTVPFVFVADEAFPLSPNMMRPFPRRELTDEKRIFNYRLSRARRQVECAFGILSSMWRILLGTIEVHDTFACHIVKAVCVLHNMILNKEEERIPFISNDELAVEARTRNNDLPACNRRPGNEAIIIRDKFMSYFVSPLGSLPWQNN
ncbi:protein antagonist of like heterochromatin protein 1 [Plakobranchus ocellatus]|uniref:Protein antagonist of like heterochromatin protein 1 n=1 Tax=Plakobranchus ocellatus TaxID=259542 RepID=A0AAV4D8Z2_9GAST|nr:protein antagonist of like heterochromatin protein 1 [Plakobranchus ocellatus]